MGAPDINSCNSVSNSQGFGRIKKVLLCWRPMDGIASEDTEFLSRSKRDAKNAKNSTQSLCTWIAHAGFTCYLDLFRIPMTSFAWR